MLTLVCDSIQDHCSNSHILYSETSHREKRWLDDQRKRKPEPRPEPRVTPFPIPLPTVTNPTACPTPTATERPKACDPEAFRQWRFGFPEVRGETNTASYDYEQRICRAGGGEPLGDYPRKVNYAGVVVAADGIDPNTCRLLECKYSDTPKRPMLRDGGNPYAIADFQDELRRYGVMINMTLSGVRPLGLEVRTNSGVTREYSERLFGNYQLMTGVNAWAVLY